MSDLELVALVELAEAYKPDRKDGLDSMRLDILRRKVLDFAAALSSPETTPAPDAGPAIDRERLATAANAVWSGLAYYVERIAAEYDRLAPETTPAGVLPDVWSDKGNTHPASLPVGEIVAAARRQNCDISGIWVQYHGDGTNRAKKGEVVVSIQYGWPSNRLAEDGRGATIREAGHALAAALGRSGSGGGRG